MKKTLWILPIVASFTACVTINIYFPAAAANKAADKIIDDVWQLKPGEKPDEKSDAAKPQSVEPVAPATNAQ